MSVPKDLSRESKKIWKGIIDEYGITDIAGLKILTVSLRAYDRAESARIEIAKTGLLVPCMGGVKASPLLTIERDSRTAFLSGLRALNLDIGTVQMPKRKRTRKVVKQKLPDLVRILIMDGPDAFHNEMIRWEKGRSGAHEAFMMTKRPNPGEKGHFQIAWEKYRDEVLSIWKKEKRKGLPVAAEMFDGKNRCEICMAQHKEKDWDFCLYCEHKKIMPGIPGQKKSLGIR